MQMGDCFSVAARQPAELQGASLEPGEEMKTPGGGVGAACRAPQRCCEYFYNDASQLDFQRGTEIQMDPVPAHHFPHSD